jgi:hypothetical protein
MKGRHLGFAPSSNCRSVMDKYVMQKCFEMLFKYWRHIPVLKEKGHLISNTLTKMYKYKFGLNNGLSLILEFSDQDPYIHFTKTSIYLVTQSL